MDLGLIGKRALVVGGSRGIGYATADALAAEGATVVIAARTRETLDNARGRLLRHGRTVLAISVDTTDDQSVRNLVQSVVGELGGLDILVNTAARAAGTATDTARLADLRDDDLRDEIETKVLGYLRTARAVAPHMIAQGWGRIINVAGLNARRTGAAFGSIRNIAVAAMTKNLSDELAPHGVNVTAIHPGTTATERTPALIESLSTAQGISPDQATAQLATGISIGRLVTADEIAAVIAFLASPRGIPITGDPLFVGGGTQGPIFY